MNGAGGIRTHGLELMRLARTATPLPRCDGGRSPQHVCLGSGGDRFPKGLAGRSRTCGLRAQSRRGGRAPLQPDDKARRSCLPVCVPLLPSSHPSPTHSVLSTPGGIRTRTFLVEGQASSPVRPRGREKLRRQGSNLRLAINSRASFRSTTPERNGGSRIRTADGCPAGVTTRCLQPLGDASGAEGEGVEPPRPEGHPFSKRDTAPMAALPEVAPAGLEPAPHRLRVGGSSS